MADDGRSYSDDETARILRKAAELHASGSPAGELERSGFDAEFIDRAASLAAVEPADSKAEG